MNINSASLPNWPFQMDVNFASAFCGYKTTSTFERLVKEEKLPKPLRTGKQRMWLRPHLEAALLKLCELPEDNWNEVEWV